MSTLKIFLLGPPHIELDNVRLELKPRKALALLIVLALTSDCQPRDTLATILWPEASQREARASLRRRLSELSASLGDGWLEIDRESIHLRPTVGRAADLWVDVNEFRQKLDECQIHGHLTGELCPACVASLTQAVALYRGDFASGFTLQDSPGFDEWQFFQTESLRQALASASERLVQWHSAQANPAEAIPFARTWLTLDPLHEPVHRWLMQLYARLGQRTTALRQYDECQRLLAEALNVTPEEATQALYLEIKSSSRVATSSLAASVTAAEPQSRIHVIDATSSPLHSPRFTEESSSTESATIFVGRTRELTALEEVLETARAGHGQLRFVTGEAGQGKSMLIQEFVRRAQATDSEWLAVTGHCHAYTGHGDPYLPFREALTLLVGEVEINSVGSRLSTDQARHLWAALPITLPALVEYAPDLIGPFVTVQSLLPRAATFASPHSPWFQRLAALCAGVQSIPLEERLIFSQYAAVLKAIAAKKPLLLILEDLHWVDLASSGLLFHLSRAVRESRILIVGSYRPDEVAQSRGNGLHPLANMVAEFKRQHGAIWLELDKLSLVENRQFIESYVDAQPNRLNAEFRAALFKHTGGHALFTVELLNAMQERGDLHQDDSGYWIGGESLDWQTLPAKVEGVIQKQLAHLDDTALSILRVACVCGGNFAAEVIAQVLDLNKQVLIQQLSHELGRQHALVNAQGLAWLGSQRLSRYSFRHYLFQHYLYQSLDATERAFLHEAVGMALQELYGEQVAQIAIQLAYHFRQAGLLSRAVAALILAGRRARQLAAYQEAIDHLTSALALLKMQPDPWQEVDCLADLGSAMDAAGNFDLSQTEEVFQRAYLLCRQLDESTRIWQVLYGLFWIYYLRGQYLQSHAYGEEALRLSLQQPEAPPRMIAYLMLGTTFGVQGNFAISISYFEEFLALYNPTEHHDLIFQDNNIDCRNALAVSQWLAGYPDQAQQNNESVIKIATDLGHPFTMARALLQATWQHEMHRQVALTKSRVTTLIPLAIEHQFYGLLPHAHLCEACVMIAEGQAEDGLAQLQQAIAELRASGYLMGKCHHANMQARGYAALGQSQAGLEVIDAALAQADESGEHFFEAELHRLKGELLHMQGEPVQVVQECFEQAIAIARGQQARMWELRATVSLCRLWQAQGKSAPAHARLAEIYHWFTEGFDTPDLLEAQSLLAELASSQ